MARRIVFRGGTYTVDQQYGRSLPRDKALSDEPLLAYDLNGEPLTRHQGRPLRLLVPGAARPTSSLAGSTSRKTNISGSTRRWYRTLTRWSTVR